jgi:heat shock protein HslJ
LWHRGFLDGSYSNFPDGKTRVAPDLQTQAIQIYMRMRSVESPLVARDNEALLFSMSRLLFLFVFGSIVLAACATQQPERRPSIREQKSSDAEVSEIVGVVWRLREIQRTNGQTVVTDEPDKYTLELLPNGQVRIRADCNRGFGSYTMKGSEISFHKTAYTRAACPPDSLFDVYTRNLEEANSYVVEGDTLHITYGIDGGIMKFAK